MNRSIIRILLITLIAVLVITGCATKAAGDVAAPKIIQAVMEETYSIVGYNFVYRTTEDGKLTVNYIDFLSEDEIKAGTEKAISLLPEGSTATIVKPGEVAFSLTKGLDQAAFDSFVDAMNAETYNYFY